MSGEDRYQEWLTGDALAVGREIMSALTAEERVRRALAVLEACRARVPATAEVDRACDMARDAGAWHRGHKVFDALRDLTLSEESQPTSAPYRALLFVAEIVAETAYNPSSPSDPFDDDASWWLAPNARSFVKAAGDDPRLAEAVWTALCISPVDGAGSIEYAKSFLNYFSMFAKTNDLFEPELAVATRVVGLMKTSSPGEDHVDEIVRELQRIEDRPHYDGTGWHGFKGAVRAWLDAKGR